jgi:uncharacterized membrane protein YecN with MAPEG domain
MPITVTALYAAIFAVFMTALAVNVTIYRVRLGISVGDGGNAQMLRMIRLHGNSVEYVPLALLLMLIFEIDGGSHATLHAAGLAMLAARFTHACALYLSDIPNLGRQIGQSLTWLTVAALAIINLVKII